MAKLILEGAQEVERQLAEMTAKLNNLSVPFKRAAVMVFASVKQNFSEGGRPTAWPPITHRKGQPLRDTGRLMASVTGGGSGVLNETHSGGAHTLEIGTNVVYANAHQFGFSGTVNVPAHERTQTKAFGRAIAPRRVAVRAHSRRANIPARPFLLLHDEDRAHLAEMFREYLFDRK